VQRQHDSAQLLLLLLRANSVTRQAAAPCLDDVSYCLLDDISATRHWRGAINSVRPTLIITFPVSRRRRREMYCGHPRLCVCVCLSAAACLHYCTDPRVTWGSDRGCRLVVHYWADLQSVHGLCCYGNITRTLVIKKPASTTRYDDIVRTRNVSECSVLALCLVSHPASPSILTRAANYLQKYWLAQFTGTANHRHLRKGSGNERADREVG